MKITHNILLHLLLLVCTAISLGATHNRSGEITYAQTGPLTIRATVTTYTKASSTGVDRDSILLSWGDGLSQFVQRSNGDGEVIEGEDIKVNYYTTDHNYPGRGTYILSFQDPNRVNNIQNVNFPNSIDVPFYVQTTFTLIESQFQGPNNSVILLQPPIDFACVGFRFVHNPNAYDPDGDSLTYELVSPFESENTPVPKYLLPNQVLPSSSNNLTLDAATGDLVWDSPPVTGEYNIAIKINEYRQGVLLNSVIRDMQILVEPCNDTPPEIQVAREICVVAGTSINIPVLASDQDTGQLVRISATGGPFEQAYSPAILDGNYDFSESPHTRNFIWDTKCEHISDSYYTVIFRGQDNSRGVTGNTVLKNLRIKVVGPPPENLRAELIDKANVELRWINPYACENTINEYFIGFRVYRKVNTNPFVPDNCEGGLDGRGYEVIKFLTNEKDGNDYVYTDENIEDGKTYCYRVLANFARRTSTGQPFNIIESLTSEEICVAAAQDLPFITEVSVSNTSSTQGIISLSWLTPNPNDLDTIANPAPYTYKVMRDDGNGILNEIRSITTNNLGSTRILNIEDDNINTENIQYTYQVDFYSEDIIYSSSEIAKSIFSTVLPSDRVNNITGAVDVPWRNYAYEFQLVRGLDFEVLGQEKFPIYEHKNLVNGEEYCYRIKSEGTYGLPRTPDTLYNYSQITCGIPEDKTGPCAPLLEVANPCELIASGTSEDLQFINVLTWDEPGCEINDLAFYRIYFAVDSLLEPLEPIAEIAADDLREFRHLPEEGINGCYVIASVDIIGNEGERSAVACVDNCPIYELPNTFTPNGDGANDIFVPIENRFVSEIDLQVYNRWGNMIYSTTNPEINWDGKDTNGNELSGGTYYYTCTVFESINGETLAFSTFTGHIQIIK